MWRSPLPAPLLRFENALDPRTGARRTVECEGPPGARPIADVVIDASEWWVLPGLYDADCHLPLLSAGLRAQDRYRAWSGGVAHANVVIPWQVARHHDLRELADGMARTNLPRLFPILGMEDGEDSEDFPAWLRVHRDELAASWPPVVKLYSADPRFAANLDAVWEMDLKAVAYIVEEERVEQVVAADGGPMHFRHAVTAGMTKSMRSMSDVSLQTSPHYLLALDAGQRRRLHVLPPVSDDEERHALVEVVDRDIDIFVTDHNAPVPGNVGPGLEDQQWFAASLITLTTELGLPLGSVVEKATSAPARIFGTSPDIGGAWILVDPAAAVAGTAWPAQDLVRAPYTGRELTGAVRAIGGGGVGWVL